MIFQENSMYHSNTVKFRVTIENNATESDWATEYLDLKLSVKIVSDIHEAFDHIRRYGSRHTEAIATNDRSVADLFLRSVDSAGVYHNCSTRFADGFRYGFGAEVGISTQTLPPRGPVGLEGLVTYRYILRGSWNNVIASIAKLYENYSNNLSDNILSCIFLFNDFCHG